ncbi:polyprenyl synthetase family protein [Lentibacillus cibarius]|uniref:Farnesyl diphosphate synthase n=1 Tax=Lentibacillus cibarius TaxID=2583219 RepID=A0A549YLE0_9BACI|nr:farnesyl diphosphate synthase [Lentibacillus cibarius]TRM12667.1 polyprenyl synthetase family protein [Lentibacillus cibarius]
MHERLNQFISEQKVAVQQELRQHLDSLDIPERLKASMLYSVEAGGKRLRPVLLLAAYQAYSNDTKRALSPAIALEMVHTYSLIHDDLPAMDNDDLRRGQPTNHKMYDEATAILAGDALLTYSFELIANDPHLTDSQKVRTVQLLSEASGPKGMVAGQMLDMKAEHKALTLEELETIHTLKTGALLRFAISTGASLGGAEPEQINHLGLFAYHLGLIFQVQDDILDVSGDPDKIGKPVGSDEANNKNTYPKLLGLEGAIAKKNHYVHKAKESLYHADAASSYLALLTDYFSSRDY